MSGVNGQHRSAEPTFWAAPEIAKAGYKVFPVKDKAPTIEGSFYGATDDLSEIAAWIEDGHGHHDVAIATGVFGKVVAIDADTPEEFEEMRVGYGPPTYTTKRGGHWLFKHPRNGKVASNKIGPGLDRKGDGGIVVVPPSKGRKWTNGIPRAEDLPMLPQEFWSKTKGPTPGGREITQDRKDAAAELIAGHVRGIKPGGKHGRHEHLVHLCGVLLGRGVSLVDAEDILKSAWGRVGGDLSDRLDAEIPNTLTTTQAAMAEERATGVPSMEKITPGLYDELATSMGWLREVRLGGKGADDREQRRRYEHTDLGNADRFVDMHGGRVRWAPTLKAWLFYDGRRWARDEAGMVVKLAHLTARSIYKDAAAEEDSAKQKVIAKFAAASQNEGRINGMLSQAKPYLYVSMDDLDRDPWVLNCLNGTLDLRNKQLTPHNPADHLTKLAHVEYDPDAACPRFLQFLKETLVDVVLIQFVKRYAGYTLTGITRERILAMLWGGGKNGKTTLVEIWQDVMGDYAQNTDVETLLAKKYAGVGNDVAALRGARLVSCAEVENGRRLAESKVKQLTGGDTVTARFLFGEPFDFRPQFKPCLSTNNKPVILGTDDAIWDRIKLVPFTQRFEGSAADPNLPEKLRKELPGILAWMVEGCLEWQAHGLGEPESVKAATDQYRAEMDTLAAFIEERCVVHPNAVAPATPLYKQYQLWCDDAGEKTETQKMFGMRLRDRGFENKKISGGAHKGLKGWAGIGLRVDHPDDDDEIFVGKNKAGGANTSGDRPPEAEKGDDRPPPENPGFAGEAPHPDSRVDDSGPLNQKVQLEKLRVKEGFGKRSPSSPSSTPPTDEPPGGPVEDLFATPPAWLVTQLEKCRGDARFVRPTCSSVAYEVFKTSTRWAEVEPVLMRHLEKGGAR